jgi:hypothetical protein
MPTTVTSSSGEVYHLWQLPDASSPEPEDSIKFTTLDNDLGDGYRSLALFGSDTGVREWKLKFPTLAHSDVPAKTVTDINGASVSREQYLRSLYIENKVTGTPFVYPDPNTGQYYLVDFVENELSMQRMRVKIFSTGLTLRQRRIPGETVFDVSNLTSLYGSDAVVGWWQGSTSFSSNNWVDSIVSSALTRSTTDVVDVAANLNGHQIKRFSNTTNDGVVSRSGSYADVSEFFIVMKMREASFSNAAGIFTGTGGGDPQALIGSSGTTKFANPSLSGYTYRLNGVEYAQSNLQAPMAVWGIVHVRCTTPYEFANGIQFGKNRTTAGTFAEMDVAEIILSNQLLPTNIGREITEYLTVKYAIT